MQRKTTRAAFRGVIASGSICALLVLAQPAFSQPHGQDRARSDGATSDLAYPMPAEKIAPRWVAPNASIPGNGYPEKSDIPKNNSMMCEGVTCEGMGMGNPESMKNEVPSNPPMGSASTMKTPSSPYTPPGGLYYGN